MISTYISKLLKEHNRVILPDLGAFILKGDSLQTAYFNEFLRFNDGLLSDYISKEENIDNATANNKIKLYVEDINKQLQEFRKAELKDFGTLFIDSTDKVQFTPAGLPEGQVVTKDSATKSDEKQTSGNAAAAQTAPKAVKQDPKPVEPTKPAPEHKSPVNTNSQPVKPKAPAQPGAASTKQAPPAKKPENQKSKKINNLVYYLLGSLIIIVTIAYILFIRSSSNKNSTEQNITIGNTPEGPSEASASASTANTGKTAPSGVKTDSKSPNPATAIPAKTGKKYYLVAGCFVIENNADRYAQKLKGQGYEAGKFAKIGELFYVCYSAYDSQSSAISAYKDMKSKGVSEVWIKYY